MTMPSARLYARATALAWRAAPLICSLLTLACLSQAAVPAVQAWIYKQLVDGIARAGSPAFDARDVWTAGALYVLVLLLAQVSAALSPPLDDTMSERLQGAMSLEVLAIGERQAGLAFYDDEKVQNDLQRVRTGLEYSMMEAVSLVPGTAQQLLIVVTLSLLLARLHPLLPLLLIASALPRFRYEARLRHFIWTGLSSRSPHFRWLLYCARVLLRAEFAKEVRLFGLGDYFLELYRRTFERAHDELVKLRRHELRGTALFSLLNAAVTGGAYVAIVLAAARREVTIGDVALYTAATFQLSGALLLLARFYGGLVNHQLRMQMFFDLVDRPPVLASSDHTQADKPRVEVPRRPALPQATVRDHPPAIEFRDAWFSYPGSTQPSLCGINLRIAPGEKIAIVGENGAGKTTLVSLLTRLYDPTRGEVCVDGRSLRALDVREWRRQIACVSQEFLQLDAPLRVNLALGDLARVEDDAGLRAACERVGLAEAAESLPRRLDQMLGRRFEGGVELSGGEWQKVALARALLREAAGVILLDEPTSALDAPTEHAIFRQFVRLAAHRTALLISHRFSTVHVADRIIVLEAGRILEEGTHATLIARGGKYAELFQMQAARYR
jgi:ABC-type multidrug transport system fused ATPase/permease subunit